MMQKGDCSLDNNEAFILQKRRLEFVALCLRAIQTLAQRFKQGYQTVNDKTESSACGQ